MVPTRVIKYGILYMDNVPVRVSNVAPAGRKADSASSADGKQKKNKKKLVAIIIGAVLLVAVMLLTVWFLSRYSAAGAIDSNRYQAVFFTSGQVYFGKLQPARDGYMKLTDVFYIQAQNTDATKDSKNPQDAASQEGSDLQLIKLGSEVHGPDDEMIISKDQVLFYENLKQDGKVSTSIAKYNSKKK